MMRRDALKTLSELWRVAKAGRDGPRLGGDALARALEACAVELGRTPVEN